MLGTIRTYFPVPSTLACSTNEYPIPPQHVGNWRLDNSTYLLTLDFRYIPYLPYLHTYYKRRTRGKARKGKGKGKRLTPKYRLIDTLIFYPYAYPPTYYLLPARLSPDQVTVITSQDNFRDSFPQTIAPT